MTRDTAARAARPLDRSRALKARAEQVIPSCTQTFSKGPTQFVQGASPVFLVRGEGCRVWDADGNEYLDYSMGLGPVILGHGHPAVNGAVERQLRDGIAFSLPHPLEVEVAERLVARIPCAEMVRFGKNGSDATAGAVRLARAATGRELVACCGYHGWQDWYIGTTTRDAGVPGAVKQLTKTFDYNRLETLERVFREHPRQVAAVIMEPVGVTEPRDGFLRRVRELASREGAVLIFDEVLTGFRLALGGAQAFFDVAPDLACFGKAIANGLPLSAVVGRRDLMQRFDEVFFSFTFGGEALSLAAALATLDTLEAEDVPAHLWRQGRRLQDGCRALIARHGLEGRAACAGFAPRTVLTLSDGQGTESLVLKSLFQQECVTRGVLFTGAHNLSLAHGPAEIDRTLAVYDEAFAIVAEAIRRGDAEQRLDGAPVQPVFRQP
jgi:glutamate-1-semialdehyde 2,1-aminomutase/spore coat polysaccharide biosynthesis protein SpsF